MYTMEIYWFSRILCKYKLIYEILSTKKGIIYSESKEIVKWYVEFGIKYLNRFFINIILCKNIDA